MTAPTTPEEAVTQNALGPKRVTVDGETVEQHPLKDQMEAASYLAGQTAKTLPHRGLFFGKLIPGGTG